MLALTSPIETPFHRLPAGVKLAVLAGVTLVALQVSRPAHALVLMGIVTGLYLIAGTSFLRPGLFVLRPLSIFVPVILVWHVVTDDLGIGLALTCRLLACVSLANLVTMTTRQDDLIAVMRWVLKPFEKLGLQTAILSFAVALALGFTPVLIGRTRQLTEAWHARSPRNPKWNILVPLTLSVIDDAERVVEALRARGGVPQNPNS